MNYLIIPIITFLVVYALTPVAKKVAKHVGALDAPNDRKVHREIIPRLGGLALYFGFIIGFLFFGHQDQMMIGVLIASFIIVIIGIMDDIKPLPPSIKFSGQILAALILMLYSNLYIDSISAFGYVVNFGFVSYLITLFFIIGAINAINLIDGLDGLAAGVSAIFFGTIVTIGLIFGRTAGNDFVLALIMLGGCLGFLRYNFNPASIFMGDSGSMLLGLIIAVISLSGYKNVTFTSLIIPLLLLAIPILDTLFAIIRRTIKKQSLSKADKEHLHHQLLNLTNSQKKTVIYIYIFNILFAFISIFYLIGDAMLAILLYIVVFVIVIWLILTTSIIKDFHKK